MNSLIDAWNKFSMTEVQPVIPNLFRNLFVNFCQSFVNNSAFHKTRNLLSDNVLLGWKMIKILQNTPFLWVIRQFFEKFTVKCSFFHKITSSVVLNLFQDLKTKHRFPEYSGEWQGDRHHQNAILSLKNLLFAKTSFVKPY